MIQEDLAHMSPGFEFWNFPGEAQGSFFSYLYLWVVSLRTKVEGLALGHYPDSGEWRGVAP